MIVTLNPYLPCDSRGGLGGLIRGGGGAVGPEDEGTEEDPRSRDDRYMTASVAPGCLDMGCPD